MATDRSAIFMTLGGGQHIPFLANSIHIWHSENKKQKVIHYNDSPAKNKRFSQNLITIIIHFQNTFSQMTVYVVTSLWAGRSLAPFLTGARDFSLL
jgi:hypothetical protein